MESTIYRQQQEGQGWALPARRTIPWPLWLDLPGRLSATFNLLDYAETSGFLLHYRGVKVARSTMRSTLFAHSYLSVTWILNQASSGSFGGSLWGLLSQVSHDEGQVKVPSQLPNYPTWCKEESNLPLATTLLSSIILQGPNRKATLHLYLWVLREE